jgi:hypothetical protein
MVRNLLPGAGQQNLRLSKVQLTITCHGQGAVPMDGLDATIHHEPEACDRENFLAACVGIGAHRSSLGH